ncbi:RNA 2',3'-cyclic phosphodiesterase [Actinoplanes teichomyceticus]|uniref:RNA 2',3'-cyclic phosphodiesterase n=1 Tax=Actinoplanes teichomyceticus TaxID=1867 RepID=A0A561WSI1_ACTTI|nr:RNA 2',3'-cyclic phosphodiesterase [Actinoplanes teichomyceticus]TWG26794.1 2'-5' RNA ligase [Actinoplanes teichomyceticus]GIF15193.1 RNA 2',3'-cyclic phosphodiesterase [Actinoplanes teichomyceticus]
MAVFPPSTAREDLRRRLPPGAHLTRPEKWHVTLAFLGEVDDHRTPEVVDALATVSGPPPFRLRLDGGGRFGSVMWVGLAGALTALDELREAIRAALDGAGFPIDRRPFRPHLTISYRMDRRLLRALEGYAGMDWPVSGFALMESEHGHYRTVQEWPLPAAD